MNANTLANQFFAVAPKQITFRGRKFNLKRQAIDCKTNVRFDYSASRKRRDEIIASKLTFAVSYDAGWDLYTIVAIAVDGETLDLEPVYNISDVYFDQFAACVEVAASK